MKLLLVFFALLFNTNSNAASGALTCPDLTRAVQVGSCPSDQELQYSFTGYCSANARMYEKDNDACASFENYRRIKNVALWESADGNFLAYLSCDLPEKKIKAASASAIAVSTQGKLTRLVCTYSEGIMFVHRTKKVCTLAGDGNCATNPAGCTAHCD